MRLRPAAILTLGLLACSAGGAAAPSAADARADYLYHGPATIAGQFVGSCEGRGIAFPAQAAAMSLSSGGGTLVVRTARINETVLSPNSGPIRFSEPDTLEETQRPWPAGRLQVSPDADGLVVGLPSPHSAAARAPLRIEFTASGLEASSLETGRQTPAETRWVPTPEGRPGAARSEFPGWSRVVDWTGSARATGDLVLYLRQATVAGAAAEASLPPYEQSEGDVWTPAAVRRTLILTDAELRLRDAVLDLPQGARPVCAGLEGRLEGGLTVAAATGTARGPGAFASFADRVLQLAGTFDLREEAPTSPPRESEAGPVRASAEGRFVLAGLDFAPRAPRAAAGPVVAAGLGLAALLAAAVLFKHGGTIVGAFYSRLRRDAVLDNATRERLLDAVRENPGADLSRLAETARVHLTTAAYHVQVLRRVGLVATLRHGRSLRVVARDGTEAVDARPALLLHDERLAYLRACVQPGPRRLAELVASLQERFGVTRRGAYGIVGRARRAGLVEPTATPEGVMVRRTSAS